MHMKRNMPRHNAENVIYHRLTMTFYYAVTGALASYNICVRGSVALVVIARLYGGRFYGRPSLRLQSIHWRQSAAVHNKILTLLSLLLFKGHEM